ncbi:hypothetical protein COCOBI_08-5540 [Coccomyxa sp. Obi]|nr:hypothetical protein COCOBI_08-5540 [Coccomyxa sp. Obi]
MAQDARQLDRELKAAESEPEPQAEGAEYDPAWEEYYLKNYSDCTPLDPWCNIDFKGWKVIAVYRHWEGTNARGRFVAYNIHRQEVLLSVYSERFCPTCYCPYCERSDKTSTDNIKAVLEQPYGAVSRKEGVVVSAEKFLGATWRPGLLLSNHIVRVMHTFPLEGGSDTLLEVGMAVGMAVKRGRECTGCLAAQTMDTVPVRGPGAVEGLALATPRAVLATHRARPPFPAAILAP